MIQQRSEIVQSFWCPQQKRRKTRRVSQFAKLRLDGTKFKVPARKSKWGRLVDMVFRRAS